VFIVICGHNPNSLATINIIQLIEHKPDSGD